MAAVRVIGEHTQIDAAKVHVRMIGESVDIFSERERRRDFKDIKAESSGVRADTHPMYYKEINVKYIIYSNDLKDNEADRFISLALTKYCSVGSSIRKDTEVKHSFEIVR